MRSHVQPGSFPLLLIAIVLFYVLNGLAVESLAGKILVQGARLGVACAGIYVLSANRVTMWLGVLVVGLDLTLGAHLWGLDPRPNRVLQDATTMAFLSWVVVVLLREVFRPSTTELDAVIGALCGFVVILTVFIRLHGLIEAMNPGSYQVSGPPALSGCSDAMAVAIFQYFSPLP